MTDRFIIGAYWGSRAESLIEVRDKVLLTINSLIEIDEQFLNWYDGDLSREKALEKKVTLDTQTIERLCLQQVKKKEIDEKGFAKNGFMFGLWTGHKDEESSSLSFIVGDTFNTDKLNNCCVLNLPYEGTARLRLLKVEMARKIITILVEIWNPDYAVLTSDFLRNEFNIGNRIGWITYHRSIRGVPKIGARIAHEKIKNGHLLMPSSPFEYDINSLAKELSEIKSLI